MPAALQPTRTLRHSLLWLTERIDSFVFPPLCIVCDQPRRRQERWLCGNCLRGIENSITSRNGCPRCGQNRSFRNCACDTVWDFPFERIISFVDYSDTVRSIMHQIKYQGRKQLARYVGRLCAPFLESAAIDSCSVVVPVPLHWLRRQRRGYNQAEWFARGLFEKTPPSQVHTGILRRLRPTNTQTKLDKSERRSNMAGAFGLTSKGAEVIKGIPVVLVDDVVTTGATTAAAASALLGGGCGRVTVVSFARD